MEESKDESEVRLYRWPLGLRQRFVTRRTMFFRLFIYTASLALSFFLGVIWGSFHNPPLNRLSHDERTEKEAVRQCCLKDIRTAQEALTRLSVDAQNLRLRLTGAGKNSVRTEDVSSVGYLEERARLVWDQLESLVQDSSDRRRKLRDIRLTLEGLKERFQTTEVCCGSFLAASPSLKRYLQIAELRFQVVQAKVSPAYIEGEMNVAGVRHESGYSYVLTQEFDTGGDTMNAPNASNLKMYEDGIALGPAHSPHADIRQFGQGRYSHWGDMLYFSASDNSDPRTNKRRYTYRSYSSVPTDPKAAFPPTSDAISLK